MSGYGGLTAANISAAGGEVTTNKSTDGTFTANSDTLYPSQKAAKTYADNIAAGLKWKQSVVVVTTANGTLASAFANGQTIDGVVLVTGNRILLKDQSTGSQNGIYTVNASGAPTRSTDADTGSELVSAAVFVEQGTVNADKAFVCTNNSITIGSTAIVFVNFAPATPGITNSAGANFGTKSDGVNLVAMRVFDDGTNIAIDSGVGNTVIGDPNGAGNETTLTINDNAQTFTFSNTIIAQGDITAVSIQPAALAFGAVPNSQITLDRTITPSGTTGAQTINKMSGAVNFAAAATSLVVTNNQVNVNSFVFAMIQTNDTTMKSVIAVPASGMFTLFPNAAPTSEVKVVWWVLN